MTVSLRASLSVCECLQYSWRSCLADTVVIRTIMHCTLSCIQTLCDLIVGLDKCMQLASVVDVQTVAVVVVVVVCGGHCHVLSFLPMLCAVFQNILSYCHLWLIQTSELLSQRLKKCAFRSVFVLLADRVGCEAVWITADVMIWMQRRILCHAWSALIVCTLLQEI